MKKFENKKGLQKSLNAANKALKENELSFFGAVRAVIRNYESGTIYDFITELGFEDSTELADFLSLDTLAPHMGAVRSSENMWVFSRKVKGEMVTYNRFTPYAIMMGLKKAIIATA